MFDFDIDDEKLVNEFVSDILKSAPKLSSDDIEVHKRRVDTRLWCYMDLIQELWIKKWKGYEIENKRDALIFLKAEVKQ